MAFGLTARCALSWELGTMDQDWKAVGQDLSHPPELGGESQGTSRFALWLAKTDKPVELTRPHSLSTALKGRESRSPSHLEPSVLTNSLLQNRGVVRELFLACKREKKFLFPKQVFLYLKQFSSHIKIIFFITTKVNEITAKY